MSPQTERTLAAIVAALGIAAMVFWPAEETPEPPATPEPVEEAAPEPDPEPAPEPEPEPEPEPAPEPEPEPVVPTDAAGVEFSYMPPGDLVPGSGTGQTIQPNYAPAMRFPMEMGQAYSNSQVYGHGGYLGPAGGQCNANNYSYAWRDNFCETRGYSTPMCPAGVGHQGQDIRPATCQDAIHWAVATEDGTITSVGSYSVRLMTDTGVRYTYLHLEASSLAVSPGDRVVRGQRLGYVSNEFGGTPTTIHLHFEIKMAIDTGSGIANTNVPPYMALVDSYERLIDGRDS